MNIRCIACLIASFLLFTMACMAQQATEVAFVHANVIPMDTERVLEDHTVLVKGDRIVAVGPAAAVAIPEGAVRIDAAGKYLTPGLAEMHGHVPRPEEPPEETENVLFLYLANGITTVRGMLGAPGQLDLRARANSGAIPAPTLYLAGPSFSGGSVHSPEQAIDKVKKQKAEGWNLLKIHPGMARDEYDAMAATARELGIRFGGHVPAEVGLMHAIDQGQDTFDHVDGYVEYLRSVNPDAVDEEALDTAIRRTKEAGAAVVPTMALWEALFGTIDIEELRAYDELKYMPKRVVDSWFGRVNRQLNTPSFDRAASLRLIDTRMHVLEALHANGVRILMGTDAPQLFSVPGFSLHRELTRMVDAGMSPYAILESGTRNVGAYFANEDDFGVIAPGQRADLLLVDANPLEDIMHLQSLSGVMAAGKWYARADLDERLEAIAASYAN